MEEKILTTKKNGMAVLLLTSLLYLAAVAVCVLSSVSMSNDITPLNITGLVLSIIWLALGWIPFAGLKVLKPQEALVLTLFGKYIGSLKDSGFYFVNPFCSAINPTYESQSIKISKSKEENEETSITSITKKVSLNVTQPLEMWQGFILMM